MDEKRKLLGNFEKILKIFDENSWIFILFFFFILFFILFFENLLLKIEPSKITPVFYNNIFGFGGGDFPLPPWLPPWLVASLEKYDWNSFKGCLIKTSQIYKLLEHFEENSLLLLKNLPQFLKQWASEDTLSIICKTYFLKKELAKFRKNFNQNLSFETWLLTIILYLDNCRVEIISKAMWKD